MLLQAATEARGSSDFIQWTSRSIAVVECWRATSRTSRGTPTRPPGFPDLPLTKRSNCKTQAAAVPSTSSLGATPHYRTAIKSAWTVCSRPNIIKAATSVRMSTLCFRMQTANSPRTKALVAAFVVLVASNVSALAWGYEGHRIIAEIAEQFLEPETAHRVRDLLAIENRTTLAEVSTWADEIRPQHPETRRWHFVSIPIHPNAGESSGYDVSTVSTRGTNKAD